MWSALGDLMFSPIGHYQNSPAFHTWYDRLQSAFTRFAANCLIPVPTPCSSLLLSDSAGRLLLKGRICITGMLICCAASGNVSSYLRNVSVCPGGCIICLIMDTFEPHSSRERLPEAVRGSPGSSHFPVPKSLGWNTREPFPFLTTGSKRDGDEATLS